MVFTIFVLTAGCSNSAPEKVAEENPIPEVISAPSETEEVATESVPTETPKPPQDVSLDELEEWDLVYINDRSAFGAQYYFVKYIEEDTGKTVNLHDYVITDLSAQTVLYALRGEEVDEYFREQVTGLKEAVAEAEVIVFFAGNYGDIEGMGDLTGDIGACWVHWECTPPDNCTPEVYQPYTAVWSEVFKEMLALREGKPTIIRALDFYDPYISGYEKCGTEMQTSCIQC